MRKAPKPASRSAQTSRVMPFGNGLLATWPDGRAALPMSGAVDPGGRFSSAERAAPSHRSMERDTRRMSSSDRERMAASRAPLLDDALTSVVKTAPGVVLGAGVVLIFNQNAASQFAVGIAVLVIALVARYARRKRGAPIQTFVAWASLGIAGIATLGAAFGPESWRPYAILAVGLLTTLAVVSGEAFGDRSDTLRAVSLAGLGVTSCWAGVPFLLDREGWPRAGGVALVAIGAALLLLSVTFVIGGSRLRGLALLGVGLPLIATGVGVVLEGYDVLGGVSLCLAGSAVASLGVAQLIGSERLRGATFIALGMGLGLLGLVLGGDAHGLGVGIALAGLGAAAVGRGLISLVGPHIIGGSALAIGGAASVVGGVVATVDGVNLLLTAVLVGFGIEAGWSGVAMLSNSDAARRLRAWWRRFTTGSDQL